MARRNDASLRSLLPARYPMKPPAKLSPAPVGSCGSSSGKAGRQNTPRLSTIIAPYSPRLITRMLGPILKMRSEEHTSELQSRGHLVCRLLLEKKKINPVNLRLNSLQANDVSAKC